MLRRHSLFVACSLALAVPSSAPGAEPVGDELVLNAGAAGEQHSPAVALTPDGATAAAWVDKQDGVSGIVFDRVSRTPIHDTQLGELPLGSTGSIVSGPRMTMSRYGFAYVVWASEGADGSGSGVVAAEIRYDDNAVTLIPMNQYTDGQQSHADVATNLFGTNTMVAWTTQLPGGGFGLRARTLHGNQALDDEIVIDDAHSLTPVESSVAVADDGLFTVAWTRPTSPGGVATTIVAQTFQRDGTPAAEQVEIASGESCANRSPDVALLGDGGFVVAWECVGTIMAARHGGAQQGTWIVSEPAAAGRKPHVSADRLGSFVVAWESIPPEGTRMVARRFENGVAGPEFVVGSSPNEQRVGDIAMDADGDVAAVWTGTDGEGQGVLARRFRGGHVDLRLQPEEGWLPPQDIPPGVSYEHRLSVINPSVGPVEGAGCATGVTVRLDKQAGESSNGPFVDDAAWTCTDEPGALACRLSESICENVWNPQGLVVRWIAPLDSSGQATVATLTSDQHEISDSDNFGFVATTIQEPDGDPDPFDFAPLADAEPLSFAVSAPVTVAGVNVPVPIFIGDGEYSVDGGPWTAEDGQVAAGDSVRVRHPTPWGYEQSTTSYVMIGFVPDEFTSTTRAADTTPEAFAFLDFAPVPLDMVWESNAIGVAGVDPVPTPISVTGGEYSVDSGGYTTEPGFVGEGSTIRVRHVTAATPSTETHTTLTIGGVSDTFTTTTIPPDTEPDPFTIPHRDGVEPGSVQVSEAFVVTGTTGAAPIRVSNGEYSVDSGAFTSTPGTVAPGASVRVRHTAASGFYSSESTALEIGGVHGLFSTVTRAADTAPDAFVLADTANVERGAQQVSAPVTIAGIEVPVPITVAGGEYSIDGGPFTSAPGTVAAGASVRVRHTSAAAFSTATDTTLTIGGVSDTFTSTTRAADTTPNPFTFVDQSGVKRSRVITSNTITVSGIEVPVAIAIAGGGNPQYAKNGGAWTNASGTVSNGDTIVLRLTSSSSQFTSVNATLSIGGVADTWSVTTGR